MNSQPLTVTLNHIKKQDKFGDFSDFLISRMGVHLDLENNDELTQRHNAYKEFRRRTKREAIASLPTMKRWFGINGRSMPDRTQVYQMCFAMELSIEETQEYLFYGLHEPAFQVNDYQEVLLAYGIYQHCSFSECLDMINELENKIDASWNLVQTQGTQMLLHEFQQNRNLERNQFIEWMLERAVFFKGYSKTSLNYFTKYKKLILNYVRQDAKKELEMLLAETDYTLWCKLHPLLPSEPQIRIRKYISYRSRKGNLSNDLQKNIKELTNIAFSSLEPNTLLLTEIFGTKHKNRSEFSMITTMTQKRLSDLLNIPIQKERYLMTGHALHYLKHMDTNLPCPEWIQNMALEYPRQPHTLQTVKDAKTWLQRYQNENKRRCLQIGRSDLLPMILYVAQRRYLESIGYDMECYERSTALEQFKQLANSTLAACNMENLSENYELDVLLCLCYQDEDIYSYTELLEATQLSPQN